MQSMHAAAKQRHFWQTFQNRKTHVDKSTYLPGDTEEVPRREPEVSSLEPRRVALPLPGQEVSRASPQYQRMLEKLNNDVKLYKSHVKHYHMSSAQFRRRTSMLGLPGEIYDKYDRIVKGCRVCSTSVPTPPRARIQGCEHHHSAI